jgi:hypothetical protein
MHARVVISSSLRAPRLNPHIAAMGRTAMYRSTRYS